MRKTLFGIVVLCGFLSLGPATAILANSAVDSNVPAIMASPSAIVLAKVTSVTIHTNIPAMDVEPGSVDLNGVAPTGVGVDSCGHLVARFDLADLALEPGEVALTLSGAFEDGGGFSATDVVTVK